MQILRQPVRSRAGRFLAVVLVSVFAAGVSLSAQGSEEHVSKEKLWVPMRDGVRLLAQKYKRKDRQEPAPVVLSRFPLNQDRYEEQARRLADAGYIALTQDCRGRYGSEGTYGYYPAEGPDGFDTIEWIRKQPWCNGQVGMWGTSYARCSGWRQGKGRGWTLPRTSKEPATPITSSIWAVYFGSGS
jgi:predicted acyl esterase